MTPPIESEKPHISYVRAIIWALPAIFSWLFAIVILLPRLNLIWDESMRAESPIAFVLKIPSYSLEIGSLVFLLLFGVFFVLEKSSSLWIRYRKMSLNVLAYLFNLFTIILILLIASISLALATMKD